MSALKCLGFVFRVLVAFGFKPVSNSGRAIRDFEGCAGQLGAAWCGLLPRSPRFPTAGCPWRRSGRMRETASFLPLPLPLDGV